MHLNEELYQSRFSAAIASGGISNDAIKDCIISIIYSENAKGCLADFGAGKGELLNILSQKEGFSELYGFDIMSKPDGISSKIKWREADLNNNLLVDNKFDVVVCSENIEHLENPRQTFRNLRKLLKINGLLILTMPNQESLRSYLSLLFAGHFVAFRDDSYPAHITALLRKDLQRIAFETGFEKIKITYVPQGGIPKFPQISWQKISMGLLKGRLFSDNIVFIARAA